MVNSYIRVFDFGFVYVSIAETQRKISQAALLLHRPLFPFTKL
jgi:hypothetical protein